MSVEWKLRGEKLFLKTKQSFSLCAHVIFVFNNENLFGMWSQEKSSSLSDKNFESFDRAATAKSEILTIDMMGMQIMRQTWTKANCSNGIWSTETQSQNSAVFGEI